jgi:ornithine cyclodeaminase/alanine dehydrogenase-like protein (mu-crystallin family)
MKNANAPHPLPSILRIAAEPYRYFTETEVHTLLTERPEEYAAFVRDAVMAIAAGRAQVTMPPKQVFTDPATGGDFRLMPCESRWGELVIKTVKLIGTNRVQRKVPDQITVGKAFALDPAENFVSSIFEACLLSSARTGLCAALAIDALARSRDRLVVIGSGRVGYYAALYAVAAAGVTRVVLSDLDRGRAREGAAALSAEFPGIQCEAKDPAEIHAADVVALATTSTRPILSPPAWGANLVVSLGADIDSQSELDPAWARVAELYVDTPDSLRFGDLRAWQRKGLIDSGDVKELLQILPGGAGNSGRPRVFISTGSALFDNLTIAYILSRAHPQDRRNNI